MPLVDALQTAISGLKNEGAAPRLCRALDAKFESMPKPSYAQSLANAPTRRVEAVKTAWSMGAGLIEASQEGYKTAVYVANNADELPTIVVDCLKDAALKLLQKRPSLDGLKTVAGTVLTGKSDIDATAQKVTRNVGAQLDTLKFDAAVAVSISGLLAFFGQHYKQEAAKANLVKSVKVGWGAAGLLAVVVGSAKIDEATKISPEFHEAFKARRDAWHAAKDEERTFDLQPRGFMSADYIRRETEI